MPLPTPQLFPLPHKALHSCTRSCSAPRPSSWGVSSGAGAFGSTRWCLPLPQFRGQFPKAPQPVSNGLRSGARTARDGGRTPVPPLTGRIRQKTDQENDRKVKVVVHRSLEPRQSGPVIREQNKRRTKKKPAVARGTAEEDKPTLSCSTSSAGARVPLPEARIDISPSSEEGRLRSG